MYFILVYIFTKRYRDEIAASQGYSPKLPLVVTILVIIQDIFYLLRLNAALPFFSSREPQTLEMFTIYNSLNVFFYLTALLVFSLKYHQAAS